MPEASTSYEFFWLTPLRAAILNLMLMGVPLCFGLLPTGILSQQWFQRTLQSVPGHLDAAFGLESPSATHPCSLFAPLPDTSTEAISTDATAGTRRLDAEDTATQNDSGEIVEGAIDGKIITSHQFCSDTEIRALYDMGRTFLQQYALTWFVIFVIWWRPRKRKLLAPFWKASTISSNNHNRFNSDVFPGSGVNSWIFALLDFHRVMSACTMLSLVLLAFFQKVHPPLLKAPPLDDWIRIPPSELWSSDFFASFVFYNLVALSFSLWTLLTRTRHKQRYSDSLERKRIRASSSSPDNNNAHQKPGRPEVEDEFMKWSIPANAIFCGAVLDLLTAVAQGQALYENREHEYYRDLLEEGTGSATRHRVRLAFGVQAFYLAVHAIWLFRVRSFLSMPQLRYTCGYQVICRAVTMTLMYKQWGNDIIQQQQPWTILQWLLRIAHLSVYFLGFVWAGQAEGFSSILTSERDEDFSMLRPSAQRRMKME